MDNGESLTDAARREVAEESGIALPALDRKLRIRESRIHYRGRAHHRIDHVFLGHAPSTAPRLPLTPTDNEKAGLIEHRGWTASELRQCHDKLLPENLAQLLDDLLAGRLNGAPRTLGHRAPNTPSDPVLPDGAQDA